MDEQPFCYATEKARVDTANLDAVHHGQAQAAPNGTESSFPVVGIGASAGGLEALGTFFDHVPHDAGLAFVIVQHLSPDFKSLMDEILARHTRITIHRVENGMTVEPNAIYLIPPKKEMIISGGKLLLTDKDPAQGLTLPIDTFLRSLAQDVGPMSVGIILSGTGSDGSRGIRAIHEVGGLAIAQSEETAKFDGMPRSAIETGVVDFILPPEGMAAALLKHAAHPWAVRDGQSLSPSALGDGLQAIIRLLRDEYGIDFSHYKSTTVTRRIERRLQMNRSLDLGEYLERLQSDAGELNSLYKDLLIGVTRFFRDREAFERLGRDVLPPLLAHVEPRDDFRVWVAGCATGEEAYSLAMLIHECCDLLSRRPEIKIFATDVHRASLEFASLGCYSEASLSDVAPERMQRYFVKQGNHYQVSPELRKMIVFAPHNLIKDAPFTRLHLVTCRNLLIYFQPQAQKKVLSLLHFGLRAGGVLFMGPSESPGEIADEFESLDDHWKLYRKRRDIRLPADMRLPVSVGPMYLRPTGLAATPQATGLGELQLLRAYDVLLEEFMPPGLLVNERRELVHTFGGAGKFLTPRDGRPSLDVLDLVHKDLKLPLTGGLQRAAKEMSPVTYTGLRVQTNDGSQQIKLSVKPIPGRAGESAFMLVSLEPLAAPAAPAVDDKHFDVGQVSQDQLHSLEAELQYTKENLQATVEEMETSNEELQATNEELVASNEELQSTNEELHSVNEELYTVNAEYQRKIVELTELTDDMDNLLRSTDIGTIFLDADLRIRKFTPQISRLFQILPQDVGRRIDSFSHSIDDRNLIDDVARVLATEERIEREVRDRNGGWFLMRILPYRSKTRIDGVVLTFIDISLLKKTAEDLRLMSKVFMDGADSIILEDLSGNIIDLNVETERTYGWRRDELLGQNIECLTPPEQRPQVRELRQRCRQAEHLRNIESVRCCKTGDNQPVLLTLSLLTDEQGKPLAISSIAKDITSRKRAEDERERYAAQLEATNAALRDNVVRREQAESEAQEGVRRRDNFLAMLSHELRNPLAAILSATYIMELEPGDNDCNDALQVIQRQSRQMSRLLDDLLDASRITQGKIEIRREPVQLGQLTQDAVRGARSVLDGRGHRVRVQIPDEPVYVYGDPARLLQVLDNLLTNAAKYTPPGGEIVVELVRDGDRAVLHVVDNGEGIPSDMLESIFDLFVQSNETLDRSDGGMGVGLTLVRNLVSMHGGTVSARSEGLHRGSEFIVRLPVCPPPASRSADDAPEANSAVPLKLVLVEDNPDSRQMLKMLLERDGYQVEVAEDGAAGLETIERERPDVAILDIGLPGLDGYEVARRVRQKHDRQQIYLIALTGYGQESDRQAVRAAGFDSHLIKPPRREELLQTLQGVRVRSSG